MKLEKFKIYRIKNLPDSKWVYLGEDIFLNKRTGVCIQTEKPVPDAYGEVSFSGYRQMTDEEAYPHIWLWTKYLSDQLIS